MPRNHPYGGSPRAYAQDTAHSAPEWAAAIRRRRLELHLTQADVAGLARVSRRTIVAIEQGRTSVTLANLLRVLAVLGLRLRVERGRGGDTVHVGD
jgi:y4mF family transcriptional regulator